MADSKIEWTDATWNPVRGCAVVSPGCANCYAMRQAHRFSGEGQPYDGLTRLTKGRPVWTGRARFVPEVLAAPLKWKRPRRVFVNSMSDLFHDDVTDEQIAAVFGVMGACHRHTFQILTKRPERMRAWFEWVRREAEDQEYGLLHDACGQLSHILDPGERMLDDGPTRFDEAMEDLMGVEWPLPNVWLGVSTENQKAADERIPLLLRTPAAVRFVSAEPLLGELDLTHFLKPTLVARDGERLQHPDPRVPSTGGTWEHGLNWVIVGGESGPGARGCNVDAVEGLVLQCIDAGVPCFVKQLGARPFQEREAEGGAHGTDEALARFGEPHPQRPWFKGWTLVHTPDGRSRWTKSLQLSDRKGGDPAEWPEALRVRQFPEARHG